MDVTSRLASRTTTRVAYIGSYGVPATLDLQRRYSANGTPPAVSLAHPMWVVGGTPLSLLETAA